MFIAHGRNDPVIEVGFARRALELIRGGGLTVDYHESDAGHEIEPVGLRYAVRWLADLLPPDATD